MRPVVLLVTLALCGCQEATRVNPGAKVAIYQRAPMGGPNRLAEFHPWDESIHLSGYPGDYPFAILHEFVHLLEKRLLESGNREGARAVRRAFRDLCGPTFEIGRNDLLGDEP